MKFSRNVDNETRNKLIHFGDVLNYLLQVLGLGVSCSTWEDGLLD